MIPFKNVIRASVGRKFLMAISGLGLVGFVIVHLLGNLTLFIPGSTAFNRYAHGLEGLGLLLEVAEVGLLFIIVLHVVTAIQLKRTNSSARPVGYHAYESKNGPSRNNVSSRNMIITGLILLGFLVLHIWQFKYGPGISKGYVTPINGEQVRDLYRLVYETFHNPVYVTIYVAVMLFLGLHLRHGFWSAFQSIGAMNPRWNKLITLSGWAIAFALAFGFLMIPFWFYFDFAGSLKP